MLEATFFLPNLGVVWAWDSARWLHFPSPCSRPVRGIWCHTDKRTGTQRVEGSPPLSCSWKRTTRAGKKMGVFPITQKMGEVTRLWNGRSRGRNLEKTLFLLKKPTNWADWVDSHFDFFWSLGTMFSMGLFLPPLPSPPEKGRHPYDFPSNVPFVICP